MPSYVWRGYDSDLPWPRVTETIFNKHEPDKNSLLTFFDTRQDGKGIWKWKHYFPVYENHFHKFRGKEVNILEIGIYSGGSLEMWREYFGPKAHLYGVDIEPACRVYEADNVNVFIGDQGDRAFWRKFRQTVPGLDVVIDDGGHDPEQQVVTFEELLPIIRPGGVYVCEDLMGPFNRFACYVHGLGHKLNDKSLLMQFPDDNERRLVCGCTPFQSSIGSIHLYPFVTVVEVNFTKVMEFRAPKHGTQWQPHYDKFSLPEGCVRTKPASRRSARDSSASGRIARVVLAVKPLELIPHFQEWVRRNTVK
jgi:hypothetical protein